VDHQNSIYTASGPFCITDSNVFGWPQKAPTNPSQKMRSGVIGGKIFVFFVAKSIPFRNRKKAFGFAVKLTQNII
jgi:hypothetical protein